MPRADHQYQEKRNVLNFNTEAHQARAGAKQTITEIIYWEHLEGGRAFHTGSIATAQGLYHDEALSALHHFGVPAKIIKP